MVYLEEKFYHVYNRGVFRRPIFYDAENYEFLLRQLRAFSAKFSVQLVSYCLMPNHYHLLLRPKRSGDMGQCLRSTFTSYTQAMNKRYGSSRTIFQGQCKAKHVTSDEYCSHLIRYIHLNPVEAGLCEHVADWRYSDYRNWIAMNDIDQEYRNAFFGNGERYKRFVEEYQRNDDGILKDIIFPEE